MRKHKTEIKLFNFLKTKYKTKQQVKFDWCKNIRHLPYDFVLEDYNIIIELDGMHHFINKWRTTFKKRYEIDQFKNKCALENNFTIIRIFQEDVWNDTDNWHIKLTNEIINRTEVKEIFISKIYKIQSVLLDVHDIYQLQEEQINELLDRTNKDNIFSLAQYFNKQEITFDNMTDKEFNRYIKKFKIKERKNSNKTLNNIYNKLINFIQNY